MSISDRKGLIEDDESFSVREQCRLLSVNRSSLYYIQNPESSLNLKIMRMIERQHTDDPARYGQKKMAEYLSRKLKIPVSRNCVQRPMRYGYMYLNAVAQRWTGIPDMSFHGRYQTV